MPHLDWHKEGWRGLHTVPPPQFWSTPEFLPGNNPLCLADLPDLSLLGLPSGCGRVSSWPLTSKRVGSPGTWPSLALREPSCRALRNPTHWTRCLWPPKRPEAWTSRAQRPSSTQTLQDTKATVLPCRGRSGQRLHRAAQESSVARKDPHPSAQCRTKAAFG